MFSIGKTVVVGTLLERNDETAVFDIYGKEYEVPAIDDQGDFKSPLNREDEGGKKTMKEYLMHPRKSAKRKLKIGDKALLTLQKYISDKKMMYKLQNAVTFVREKNIQDDLEYRGFSFEIDDIQQFIKKSDDGLPLYLVKINNAKKELKEVLENISVILENKIVPYGKINYKDDKENHITKRVVLEKQEDVEEEQLLLKDLEKEVKDIEYFTFSFFISSTKQYNVLTKYEKVFKNNAIVKKPKTDLEKLTNEDIHSFFEEKEESIDNNDIFEKKIVFGKQIGDRFLMAPSIISVKESYNKDEESFFLLSSVIPDVINIRKRAKDFIKASLEKED